MTLKESNNDSRGIVILHMNIYTETDEQFTCLLVLVPNNESFGVFGRADVPWAALKGSLDGSLKLKTM